MTRTWTAAALLVAFTALPAFAGDTESAEAPVGQWAIAAASTSATETFMPIDTLHVTVTAEAPQRGSLLPALYTGFASLQAYDAYSTLQALSLGASEANPFMKSAAQNPAVLLSVKAGVAASTIYMSERLRKANHRKAALLLMVASNLFYSAVALNNARVLRSLR